MTMNNETNMNTLKIDIKGSQPETVEVNGAVYEPSIHLHQVPSMRAGQALDELAMLYCKVTGMDTMPQNVQVAGAVVKQKLDELDCDFKTILARSIETREAYEKKDTEQVRRIRELEAALNDSWQQNKHAAQKVSKLNELDDSQNKRIRELEADNKRLSALVNVKIAENALKQQQLDTLRLPQFDCEVRVDQERVDYDRFGICHSILEHGRYAIIKTNCDQWFKQLTAVKVGEHWYLSAEEAYPVASRQHQIDSHYQAKFDSLKKW